jgi:hypothetical protein
VNSKEAARRAGIYAPDSRFRGNDEGDGVGKGGGKGGGKGDGEGNGKPDSRLSGMTWKWNARRLNLFGYIPRHLRRTIRKYCPAEDTPPLGAGGFIRKRSGNGIRGHWHEWSAPSRREPDPVRSSSFPDSGLRRNDGQEWVNVANVAAIII